jgi:ABC-type Mn2+/Zn2+ transport system permease subunit
MIDDFLASWSLFRTTYLAGWLIAVQLALVGVWVVARNQIFLGVAVAQASTLGIAVGLWLAGAAAGSVFAWLGSDALAAALAVTASVATALLTAREAAPGRESPEALTGWVYLLASSVPVLLLAQSPHGLEEVHQLLFSTLLAASPADLRVFAALTLATLLLVAARHRALLLFALDPDTAVALGLRRRLWNAAVAVWLGVSVGLSIRVAGTLFSFGCLVLPALLAKNLAREVRGVLLLAPALSLLAALAGFTLAHRFDVPPAHASVALLCAGLLLAWAGRAWQRGRSG